MLIIVVGSASVVLIAMFITFDKLVKIQHTNYFDKWVEDGKPTGFFSLSIDECLMKDSLSRNIRFLVWSFFTDEWMKNDEKALKLSRLLRLLSLIYWVLMFIFLFLILRQQ